MPKPPTANFLGGSPMSWSSQGLAVTGKPSRQAVLGSRERNSTRPCRTVGLC